MNLIEIYRGYEIRHAPIWQGEYKVNFVHPDYDGPPNRRCGSAKTVEEAKARIDEIEDDE